MRFSLAGRSLLVFGICLGIMVLLTLLDPVLGAPSFAVQRTITFLGFVLPAGIGSVLGVMSLVRKEGRAWLAVTGIALNSLFALFHLMIIFFAG